MFIDETPERIELENQTHDPTLSEEHYNEMDEDEWSDINFGNSLAVDNESRFISCLEKIFLCFYLSIYTSDPFFTVIMMKEKTVHLMRVIIQNL